MLKGVECRLKPASADYSSYKKGGGFMNLQKYIGAGLLAGIIFYVLSLGIWKWLGFLPVVPLAIAIPGGNLGSNWPVVHGVVSLLTGLLWTAGYAVYGKARPGGWQYGIVMYVVATVPAVLVGLVLASGARSVITYSAIVSLVGTLLAGKTIEWVAGK